MSELMLRETMNGAGEAWYQEWYCEVPGRGVRYRVLDEDWDAVARVRRVRRIALPGAAEEAS